MVKAVTFPMYESPTELLHDRGTSQNWGYYTAMVRVSPKVVTRKTYESR